MTKPEPNSNAARHKVTTNRVDQGHYDEQRDEIQGPTSTAPPPHMATPTKALPAPPAEPPKAAWETAVKKATPEPRVTLEP